MFQEAAPYPDGSVPFRLAIPLAPAAAPAVADCALLLAGSLRGSVASDGLQARPRPLTPAPPPPPRTNRTRRVPHPAPTPLRARSAPAAPAALTATRSCPPPPLLLPLPVSLLYTHGHSELQGALFALAHRAGANGSKGAGGVSLASGLGDHFSRPALAPLPLSAPPPGAAWRCSVAPARAPGGAQLLVAALEPLGAVEVGPATRAPCSPEAGPEMSWLRGGPLRALRGGPLRRRPPPLQVFPLDAARADAARAVLRGAVAGGLRDVRAVAAMEQVRAALRPGHALGWPWIGPPQEWCAGGPRRALTPRGCARGAGRGGRAGARGVAMRAHHGTRGGWGGGGGAVVRRDQRGRGRRGTRGDRGGRGGRGRGGAQAHRAGGAPRCAPPPVLSHPAVRPLPS